MRKTIALIIIFVLGLGLTGCTLFRKRTAGIDQATRISSLSTYSGPKAMIKVTNFDLKTIKATEEIGLGLREMLIAALINSNRFRIVEKDELTADLVMSTVVIEFKPQFSGGSAGVGGAGGVDSGMLGGILGETLNKAHIVLDMRIIDKATSQVVATKRAQGQASETIGSPKTELFEKQGLVDSLSAYVNTPMEKAIRFCIVDAVNYISQNIPAEYYKY